MSGGATNPSEAEHWLGIAEKRLQARDLVGCKKFAERAILCDPLVRGVDQILAVAEVHLAARNNSKMNWYSILQLDPAAADSVAVKRQYRRLALLLHPANNKSPGAAAAFKLVVEAHTVLSDSGKKSVFDAELEIATARTRSTNTPARSAYPAAAAGGGGGGNSTFWTACPFCFYAYQYGRRYSNWALRCPTCQQVFRAVETAVPRPISPGTDMYYSAWGFYMFPGVSAFLGWWNQPGQLAPQQLAGSRMHVSAGNSQGPPQPYGGNVNVVQPQETSPLASQQGEKRVTRKRDRDGVHKTQVQLEPKAAWLGPETRDENGVKGNTISGMHANAADADGELSIFMGATGNVISDMHVDPTLVKEEMKEEVSIFMGAIGNIVGGMYVDPTVVKEEVSGMHVYLTVVREEMKEEIPKET